jgi:molecular chaperone GrpE
MKRENEVHEKDGTINTGDSINTNNDEVVGTSQEEKQNSAQKSENTVKELEALKIQLEEKTKQSDEYFDKLQRKAAEFDNYRKRTVKEKEAIYSDTVAEVVASFLPVVDNLERALKAADNGDENSNPFKDGVELIYKQLLDVLKNLGVAEIKCVGEPFNPELHNAVMHVADEAYGENVIVEEFQKGYVILERVIRHSMVKVAN